MDWLQGKKTYIVSSLMALASLMHLITGEMSLPTFVTSDNVLHLLEAVGLTTLRAGVAKNDVQN
ncbi:MAG: hypothetical protein COV67_08970 [Nitrospinae bacterium CG11_big_fil_rev_8_21_14_0_20_56_8]|nr:MAG: hypothetical protein COV67_08970 [Nitrospinae bacterium CG11_big_fil_rev_8_21_14_0_20_56_8]